MGISPENTVRFKSKRFAIRITHLYLFLTNEKKEYVLSKQIFRSGTSIGANVVEAECGFSRKDFHAKMQIAFKECAETMYWLELLFEGANLLTENQYKSLLADCEELQRMLSAITKSMRESIE